MDLHVGDPAPSFDLPSTTGQSLSLASLRGKKVVLYFYPKDQTPGCTRESCDFRDRHEALEGSGAVVLGVSKDSLKSHENFREKQGLPFPLLSDADNAVARAYGAYGEKMMYGKPVTGTIRSTFLIDEDGKIARIWSPVKVDGHAEEVLAAVRGETGPDVHEAPPPNLTTGAMIAAKTQAGSKPMARTAAKPRARAPMATATVKTAAKAKAGVAKAETGTKTKAGVARAKVGVAKATTRKALGAAKNVGEAVKARAKAAAKPATRSAAKTGAKSGAKTARAKPSARPKTRS